MVPNAKSKILFAGSGTYTCSCRGVMHPVVYALSDADTGAVFCLMLRRRMRKAMHLPMLWPMPIITSWTRSEYQTLI